MALTDNSDIFASFHEDGFNQIIHHIRTQRPSLFNYVTAAVAENRKLLCHAIDVHPIVFDRNNPQVTIIDPLPIPGTDYGVNFAVQLVDFKLDFHPADELTLPPELDPPLKEQHLAIKLKLCGGIGCLPKDSIDEFISRPVEPDKLTSTKPRENTSIIPLPSQQLTCFCLQAYATGGVRIATYNNKPYLEPFLDGLEIVDIEPTGLENSLECYLSMILKLTVLPNLRILLQHMPLNLTQGVTDLFQQPTNITLSPMPVSATLPNNPAIEEDLVKAFIKVEVT